jgi:hypothetical protein
VIKTTRPLFLVLPAIFLAIAACGGDDDDSGTLPGQLTDPQTVPTATPWDETPEVIVLDPENIQPLPPSQPDGGGNGGTATPAAGEPGDCGETYIVVAGDTTFGIADKCGVSVEGIEAANPDIDIRSLTIGQEINLPPASEE